MTERVPEAIIVRRLERPLLTSGERLAMDVERVTGGGGEKYHPQSFSEARELLLPMAQQVVEQVREIPPEVRSTHVIFQATLLPNYLANTYFPAPLLEAVGLRSLGSRLATGELRTRRSTRENVPTKSLILAGTDDALERLVDVIDSGATTQSRRAAVDNVRQFSDIRLAQRNEIVRIPGTLERSDLTVYEAILHPSPELSGPRLEPLEPELFDKWRAYVAQQGGIVEADYVRTVGGLLYMPVRAPAEALDALAAFNLLRTIRPMPEIEPFPEDDLLRAIGPDFDPPIAAWPTARAKIAVVDGGVDVGSPFFAPYVTQIDRASLPPNPRGLRHGTAVSGAALYGDVSKLTELPAPPAAVDHYRVFPSPSTDVDAIWLLDQIEALTSDQHYPIVNLSLGPRISVEDDAEPHPWTAKLDEIAYERGVLFVVAAGNNGMGDAATGLTRVQVPADMVNGLSVGASDTPAPEVPWERAPYSPIGPGRTGARVQPAGLSFGGTDANPFHGLQGDGRLYRTQGTSLAAPVVTHGLATLRAHLDGRATANTLRAFAVHLAEAHAAHDAREHGHGRFAADYTAALECDPDSVTVLYEGAIARDEVVALPLPLPPGIARGNVTLSWTLVVQAPTQPTEPLEYTRAALDLVFRPHADRYRYAKEGERAVVADNHADAATVAALLAEGFVPSTHPVSRSLPSSTGDEADRRDGGKWETIRRGDITMRATSLLRPRLDVSHVAREHGTLAYAVPDLNYSLLATVRGPRGSKLYEKARAEFSVLTPVRAEVRVRPRT